VPFCIHDATTIKLPAMSARRPTPLTRAVGRKLARGHLRAGCGLRFANLLHESTELARRCHHNLGFVVGRRQFGVNSEMRHVGDPNIGREQLSRHWRHARRTIERSDAELRDY
jgi:hypothetical protein